jgi:ankyrin repeat protein
MRAMFLVLGVCLSLAAEPKLPPAAQIKVDFEKHVQPLLAQKCHSCHGEDVQQSGLRLDKRQNAMRGGDYGPVINPGNSAESKLIRRLVSGDGGLQMPPTGALSDDEIGLLRAWIDQGADFRITIKDEAPPKPVDPKLASLIAAVRTADARAFEKLIKQNPAITKATDNAGSTLLHHAAGFGTIASIKLLLDSGADVNAKNRRTSTPLHWAIHDEAKIRLLIERGAAINAKQADGRTPLYQAASMGNANAILRLLFEKGGDPGLSTAAGQTPLMAAAARADVEAMRLLIENNASVDAKSGTGATALMGAAASGNARAVQLLIEKGADVNAMTKRNETPLANAATSGNAESVKLLLDRGAKVNAQDHRGYSALMYAAASETMPSEIIKLLLAAGADTSLTGEGETARTLGAKRGDTEVARLLGVSEQDRKQGGVPVPAAESRVRPLPERVQRALALLERQSHNFIRIGGCNSCHAQDLPSAAAALARDRGLPAPKIIAQLPLAMTGNSPERMMDLGAINVTSAGWELFDLGMNRVPKDQYTDALVRYIKAMQTPEGKWKASESRRPPMNAGTLQTTALAVYALQHYTPQSEKADTDKALARAAAWLEKEKPVATQDRAFHLLALSWSKAASAAIERAGRTLAAMQHADGGWAQLVGMGSDAYATGQVLYALNTASKMPATDPVYQKGARYLLHTQADDGSWHVKTRSIWIQPYFESGFPYGHDQWISAAGTSWAVMALSLTVEPQRISRNVQVK